MTSRTHDNFRHNFWTWVWPPPSPVWRMLKKTALFSRDGFPKPVTKGRMTSPKRMNVRKVSTRRGVSTAVWNFSENSHVLVTSSVPKGSPHFKKVQFFWTLFKRPLAPPPLLFEHLSYFAGGVFVCCMYVVCMYGCFCMLYVCCMLYKCRCKGSPL